MAQGMWDVLVQGACDEAISSMRRQGLEDGILSPSSTYQNSEDGWGALSGLSGGAQAACGSEFVGLSAAAGDHALSAPADLRSPPLHTPAYPAQTRDTGWPHVTWVVSRRVLQAGH